MNEINKYKDVYVFYIDNYFKKLIFFCGSKGIIVHKKKIFINDVLLIKKNMKTNSDKHLEECLI